MTGSIQCVFLIDESVFCLSGDINCQLCDRLRLAILRVLCYLSSSRARSSSCVRWSYKFFDSDGIYPQITEKQGLSEFCLENFEDFEACLGLKAERKVTIKTLNTRAQESGLVTNAMKTHGHPSKILSLAFHQLYADFVWDLPDISSPIKTTSHCRSKLQQEQHENYIFVLASLDIFLPSTVRSDPFKKLLPKSLHETFVNLVHLLWIDTNNSSLHTIPKVKNLLPLELLTGDTSCLKNKLFLPVSTLMNYLLTPKQGQHSRLSYENDSRLALFISGKELCQLSLTSYRRTDDKEIFAYNKADILGTLPASWIPQESVLKYSSMIATHTCSTEGISSSTSFATLLQQLKKDSRILVLQLYTDCSPNDYPANLSFLQPFGQSVCIITLLTPGITLSSLIAHAPKRTKTKQTMLVPSFLEAWAVANPSSSFLNKTKPVVTKSRRHSLKEVQHFYQKFSSILTLQKAMGKNLRSLGSDKALEQDVLKPSKSCKEFGADVLTPDSKNIEETGNQVATKIKDCANDAKALQETEKSKVKNQECHYTKKQLQEFYENAVIGTSSVEKVAEVIIWGLHTLALAQNLTVNDLAVQEQFLLTAKTVGDKHEAGGDSKGIDRQRELQLQALLRLELLHLRFNQDTELTQDVIQELTSIEKSTIQEVVVLLRTFSFLAGALELNTFLLQTVKNRYVGKLQLILQEISEELNVPLSSGSDSSSDDESFVAESQPQSNCSQSSYSSLSSISQQPKCTTRKSWGRSLSMLNAGSRRQIKVPRSLMNSTATSQSPKYSKYSKKTRHKKSSGKNSKTKVLDDKHRTGQKRACRNLLEKLDQEEHPILMKSKSENLISLQEHQKQLSYSTSNNYNDYSPVKVGFRSHRRQSQGSPRTPRHKTKHITSPRLKKNSSPRTPKHKSRSSLSGFTPNKTFPDLFDTPDKEEFKSPSLRLRSSPRTPRQNARTVTSGFTPSDKFPDLTNTPDPKNIRSQCSPRSPKQGKHIGSGFTPSLRFPDQITTPDSKTKKRTFHSTDRHCVLTDSPASCTRSKCTSSPSSSLRTPLRDSKQLQRRSQSSSCIRKLTLDSPTKDESCVLSARTPKKKSENIQSVSPSRPLGTTKHDMSSSSPNKTCLDKVEHSSRSPKCIFTKTAKKTSDSEMGLTSSPLKSCLKQTKSMQGEILVESPMKQVRISGDVTNDENMVSFYTPRKRDPTTSSSERRLRRTNSRTLVGTSQEESGSSIEEVQESLVISNAGQTEFEEVNSKTFFTDVCEKDAIQEISTISKVEVPEVPVDSHPSDNSDEQVLLQEEAKLCSNKAALITPKKVPVLQLYKLPESSDKTRIKTSPVLSMRWPQRKRKLSSIQKKCEDLDEKRYSPNPKCQVITPPSKKLQVNKQYASPSTMSILHLTTSPVISCSNSFKSNKLNYRT